MPAAAFVLLVTLICVSSHAAATAAVTATDREPTSPAVLQAGQTGAAKPLATAEGSLDRVRVDVTELRRSAGETVSLRFTIVNESDRALQVSDVGISDGALITPADGSAYTIGGVHVIDVVGKKKYFVARDGAGGCVCSQFGSVPPKSRRNHWARFSAPPDNVDRLTVVIPGFAPMDDVPLSR